MDQSKLIGILANDVANQNAQPQAPVAQGAKEIRPLNDFELVIAAGGDSIVIW